MEIDCILSPREREQGWEIKMVPHRTARPRMRGGAMSAAVAEVVGPRNRPLLRLVLTVRTAEGAPRAMCITHPAEVRTVRTACDAFLAELARRDERQHRGAR